MLSKEITIMHNTIILLLEGLLLALCARYFTLAVHSSCIWARNEALIEKCLKKKMLAYKMH